MTECCPLSNPRRANSITISGLTFNSTQIWNFSKTIRLREKKRIHPKSQNSRRTEFKTTNIKDIGSLEIFFLYFETLCIVVFGNNYYRSGCFYDIIHKNCVPKMSLKISLFLREYFIFIWWFYYAKTEQQNDCPLIANISH